ncbi:MAG: TFIIB-type zinc ribbon-containing protein [Pyrobaculum sp.]
MRCPFCGAEFEAPPGRRFYACPYCGTVVSEGRVYEDVYVFQPRVDKTGAFRQALYLRPTGAPEDLPTATLTKATLHFLPLYLYYVSFPPLDMLASHVAALAVSNPPVRLPKSYVFPARWRMPFKPSLNRAGVFHAPDLDPADALNARRDLFDEVYAYADVFKIRVRAEWRLEGIVYYPLWELEYLYHGKSYEAVVDAVDGSVLYLEYPLSGRGRAYGLGAALAVVLGAAAFGSLVASFFNLQPLKGGLGGAVASLGAVARLAAFSLSAKGRYEAGQRL